MGNLQHADWKNPDYQKIWDNLELDPNSIDFIKKICMKIVINKEKYQEIAGFIGCPWWFISALHYRESSLSFTGVLHNGDKIIGTGRVTYHVPKGRGPFATWEESAIDVLRMKKYHLKSDWDIATCLERSEYFNGLGYRKRGAGEYSPYVCAGTNMHDETGKYVADGRYRNSAKESQLGTAAIWKGLELYFGVELN